MNESLSSDTLRDYKDASWLFDHVPATQITIPLGAKSTCDLLKMFKACGGIYSNLRGWQNA